MFIINYKEFKNKLQYTKHIENMIDTDHQAN